MSKDVLENRLPEVEAMAQRVATAMDQRKPPEMASREMLEGYQRDFNQVVHLITLLSDAKHRTNESLTDRKRWLDHAQGGLMVFDGLLRNS